MEGREDWKRYYNNSVIVPTCDTDIIGEAAREANAYVSMGINRKRCNKYIKNKNTRAYSLCINYFSSSSNYVCNLQDLVSEG